MVTRRQVASTLAKAPWPGQGGNASVLRLMTTSVDDGREPLKAMMTIEKCGHPEVSVRFWRLGPEQR